VSINPSTTRHNGENPEPAEGAVLFKIIGRLSWDNLQAVHHAWPGSTVEHVLEGTGIYVGSGPQNPNQGAAR
jgi:hypothetical protein